MTLSTQRERRQRLDQPLGLYERMLEVRRAEEVIQQMYADGTVRGSTHLSNGQEAVAVGIAAASRPEDTVTCTYRGHGVALALGMTPTALFAELAGRRAGCTGGLGGSMHLSDADIGLLPTFAIVGAGLPVAAGAALTAQVLGTGNAAIAVFGDGATNIGAFHEALNLAAIWQLPVVFVCENNLYGEYSRIELTTPVSDLASRASSYAMPGVIVDGQDVLAVRDATAEALGRARDGAGPSLLEMKTYRYSGHSRSDPAGYRLPGELDQWLARDPVMLYRQALLARSDATEAELATVDAQVDAALRDALAEALDSPVPAVRELLDDVLSGGGR